MRRLLICGLSAMAAIGAAWAQENARMTDTELGPVRGGMSIAELRAAGLQVTTREGSYQDIPYTEFVIVTADGVEIIAGEWRGRTADLVTASPAFTTPRGARVGSTLAELRRLYPEGETHIGESEDGRYFNFDTAPHQPSGMFLFDADRLSDACIAREAACPDLGGERATQYATSYERPETSLRPRAIGPVFLGMTRADVQALGFRMQRVEERGANAERYIVSVDEGGDVSVTFRNGRAWRLVTSSQGFHAYRGGYVGVTLNALRSYYPEGRLERGSGPYVTFVIAPGHGFMFDTREDAGTCTTWDGTPCPEFDWHRAIRYSVSEE